MLKLLTKHSTGPNKAIQTQAPTPNTQKDALSMDQFNLTQHNPYSTKHDLIYRHLPNIQNKKQDLIY